MNIIEPMRPARQSAQLMHSKRVLHGHWHAYHIGAEQCQLQPYFNAKAKCIVSFLSRSQSHVFVFFLDKLSGLCAFHLPSKVVVLERDMYP